VKGTILDYSIQTSEGIISGDDNNRYKFAGSEWKVSDAPMRGQRVDFDVLEGRATSVYQEPSNAINKVQSGQAPPGQSADIIKEIIYIVIGAVGLWIGYRLMTK
jgi:hypothetical protein